MNVGKMIFEARRADREREFIDLMRETTRWKPSYRSYLQAWLWWGWKIHGKGGLGYPGIQYGTRRYPRAW